MDLPQVSDPPKKPIHGYDWRRVVPTVIIGLVVSLVTSVAHQAFSDHSSIIVLREKMRAAEKDSERQNELFNEKLGQLQQKIDKIEKNVEKLIDRDWNKK